MERVTGLAGKKVVVVGASAGLGRSTAACLISSGAEVIVAARRIDELTALVEEAGGGTVAGVDITDAQQRQALVALAKERLGSVDLLLITTGAAALTYLADTTPETWAQLFTTNVAGVNLLVAEMISAMDPGGMVVAISSESVDRPRAGLAAYSASKAALQMSLEGWRIEHAPLRFSCVSIGATVPTEFANRYDPELMGIMIENWVRHGHLQAGFMATDDVALALTRLVGSVIDVPTIGLEHVVLRSPAPVMASVEFFAAMAEAEGAPTEPPGPAQR